MSILNKPIYMIMVCTKLEEKVYEHVEDDGTTTLIPSGLVTCGDTDVVGFYFEKEEAIEDVEANACDINETIYKYAVIEEIYSGLYPISDNRWIFEFDRDSEIYVQIDEPEILKKYLVLTMR